MPIELLYIVPILAVVILGFLLVMNTQKRSMEGAQQQMAAPTATPTGKLPGDTKFLAAQKSTEERLNEYEQTIAQINKSLSNQHMVIEKFQEENVSYNDQIEKLQAKLRELHKEYDIVISENYSLRAKVKSLQKKIEAGTAGPAMVDAAADALPSQRAMPGKEHVEMNMNLYEDTRLFKASGLDDASEFEISDLK
jgi:septal ring factor EnvC (AmiA/AmiB activator)